MSPYPLNGVWARGTVSHECHTVDDSVAKPHVAHVVSEYVHFDQLQGVQVATVGVLVPQTLGRSVNVTFVFGILECNLLGIQPVDVSFEGFGFVVRETDMLLLAFFPIVLQGRLYVLRAFGCKAFMDHELLGLFALSCADSDGVGQVVSVALLVATDVLYEACTLPLALGYWFRHVGERS